jgi:hypothetical protein
MPGRRCCVDSKGREARTPKVKEPSFQMSKKKEKEKELRTNKSDATYGVATTNLRGEYSCQQLH